MKKFFQQLSDWLFCYVAAWWLIITSPLWLPVWLAVKIYKFPKEHYEGIDED